MPPETIFRIHLVLGYVAWLLCFGAYILPRLRSMGRVEAQRAIATLHSFRFFGLVFMLPGVVGPNLPAGRCGWTEIRSKVVTARLSHARTLLTEMGRPSPYFSPGGAFHAIAALVFTPSERAHL
jgi:hypothetical protein